MRARGFAVAWALGAVAGTSLVAAAAVRLPGLPAPHVYRTSADSPGPVTFDHESHVDPARPDCTGCHPASFRIVRDATRPAEPVTHAAMEAGRQCGACHDGTSATGLDECDHCHGE